jgi:DNA (cytosine-5)-methyltransferase 1
LFANDFDPKKASTYIANWGDDDLLVGDVAALTPNQLPSHADLAWASFPCQDLSLAGDYVGLHGKRSGTFWPFWRLMKALRAEGRGPRVIVLENVYGAITSNGGEDFQAIASAFANEKYTLGAMVIDARHWVPHSRPRLFFVGVRCDVPIPSELHGETSKIWHPRALVGAVEGMSQAIKNQWVWWNLPTPAIRNVNFIDVIEGTPTGCDWHTKMETDYLISLMAPRNLEKLQNAIATTKANKSRMVGGVYRRTRDGQQRAEIRFDDIAGCLRTPAGGSSRQAIILVESGRVKSRLLSPREAARLMGLPENYRLPERYNESYHVCGDGVVVPVVRHLAENLIEPILEAADTISLVAAE